ncbi:basement membrane-specific heparan sulfate proteoglycan core protein-like isoform X2 [Varroa jacobsoni]|uniref:basement membrane-specific heparan sulfate proteoglycan core protein-like isoform X2 n=1 Tax=Varroa jacobsoni TaxID=62625 RepID=UPI000BF25117|nr:basement membrane-specific heparan sulfate proteoglycan core protein-like isoform X2 [Varroa jacobsoni]
MIIKFNNVTNAADYRALTNDDLYFGGKSVLRCAALEMITQPRQVEWYHEDELIYVSIIQAQRNGIHLLSHSPSATWGGRALFNPKTVSLHLTRLTPQDAGRYTCRVLGLDGGDSANETFYVRGPMRDPDLQVESPTFRGAINSSTPNVGPFHEGQSLDLYCTADPAFPQAEVMWYTVNDDLQRSSLTMPEIGQNHLRIESLGRLHEGVRLSCRAEDKRTGEQRQSIFIKLNIYFRPLEITTSSNRVLYAWETSELECVVSGSRPAPEITWFLGRKRAAASFTHTSFNGNVTTSSLAFKAHPEHHGLTITCRATNAAFPNDILEESWNLVVHYAPVVDLYPCSRRETQQPLPSEFRVSTGSPAGFIFATEKELCLCCSILANPSPNSIRWSHNGNLIELNSTSSLLRIGPPLQPHHEGTYSCLVRNSVGETNSAPLRAIVHCTPNQMADASFTSPLFRFRFVGSVMALAVLFATALTIVAAWRRSAELDRRNPLDAVAVLGK